MSEPKLISPMLDNFAMGGPISEHHGVRCCPAMENESDDKYIVKIISVPASQTQLDALLLTGVYPSKDAALAYFKELSDSIIEETDILNRLSQTEGFLPFRDCQCVPMEDASGYDVYLLSTYKRTLAKQFKKNPLTQLEAVNLGLDLCAALSVCRRAGYMYLDLKPNNIFVTPDKQFRIGDLGFIRLNSLKYASLPDKYRSQYTAPEIEDAFSSLNTTLDIYALGLILYQVYNTGSLPFDAESPPAEPFPAPAYADYEISEIILKACAPNPEDRWQDPMQMGQALVSYMQRNGVNDTPIIPPPEPEVLKPIPEEPMDENRTSENISRENEDNNLIAQPISEDERSDEEASSETADIPAVQTAGETSEPDGTVEEDVTASAETEEAPEPEVPDAERQDNAENCAHLPSDSEMLSDSSMVSEQNSEISTPNASDEDITVQAEKTITGEPQGEVPASIEEQETEYENLSFLDDDETDCAGMEIDYNDLTDEVSQMLFQADDLADLVVPEPVVPPEAIDVPIPEPIPPEEPEAPETSENQLPEESDVPSEDLLPPLPQKNKKHWVRISVIILAVAVLLAGGFFFYKEIYLIPVDSLKLEGSEDNLTVLVETDADEALLTVVCTDAYGTQITAPLTDGKATFTNLIPNTAYTVKLVASGFHEAKGSVTAAYSTPVQTNIVQFSAVTGQEDGSVILGFTVEGPDSPNWNVAYSAEGEPEKIVSFPSHIATLNGLTVGKEYTFRIYPEDALYIAGSDTIKHTASKLVYAQNLKLVSFDKNILTVQWDENPDVSAWYVRVYDEKDYNKTISTSETTAQFAELNPSSNYTVEVTAAGMSVAQRTYITANSVTVMEFQTDDSVPGQLSLSWKASAEVPADGWILSYTVDGAQVQEPAISKENAAVISPVVPGGVYEISMKCSNDAMILGMPVTYTAPEASEFTCTYGRFTVTASDMTFRMCRTPAKGNWSHKDLKEEDYTNTFAVGEKASFLVKLGKEYGTSSDSITTLYVVRDSNGKPVSAKTASAPWVDMWYRSYCELDIPAMPTQAGSYSVSVYFNGALACTQQFDIA